MSIVGRLTAPRDLTHKEASIERERDIKRLQQGHLIEWEYVLTPSLSSPQIRYRCTCNVNSWFNEAALTTHIKDVIRAERGPKK